MLIILIIETLLQVEGIFSGTLSYIFNSFVAGGPAFSEIVSEAKAAGWAPFQRRPSCATPSHPASGGCKPWVN